MAEFVTIDRAEIFGFLEVQGFAEITLPGTKELVMAKVVDATPGKEICLRIYTSVVGTASRDKGEDAIRSVLVTKVNGAAKVIGADKRVHRVKGWRANLQDRIDTWQDQLGPTCGICGRLTVQRRSNRGPFHGCVAYPECRGIVPWNTAASPVPAVVPAPAIAVAPPVKDVPPPFYAAVINAPAVKDAPPPFEDEFQQRLAMGEIDQLGDID